MNGRLSSRERVWLTLPFYLLFVAQLVHHEIWRDEINAWTIAWTSPNLSTLLARVHYEAHPALWYLILYAAGKCSHSLWVLKLVTGIIGTGTYFLLARDSPLRRLEYLLVLLSYYLVFEYTVLCRMYGLELLFALAYLHVRTKHPSRIVRNTLWLGLMANVDATGGILAGALLLEYLVSYLSSQNTNRQYSPRNAALAIVVFLCFVAVSIKTLLPAKDIGWSTTGRMFSHFTDSGHLLQAALKWIAVPWLPRSINILDSWAISGWPYFFLAPIVLLMLYLIFRDHPRLSIIMAAVMLVGILFTQITNVAGIRHTGIVFIAFLVCLSMMRAAERPVSIFAIVLLGLTAITGIIAIIDQWSWPYSETGPAARWIAQQHLQNLPIFGTPDSDMLAVPERLDRPFYQLECNCADRYFVFSQRRETFDPAAPVGSRIDVPTRLAAGMRKEQSPEALFLMTRPFTPPETSHLAADGVAQQLLAKFDQGFLGEENIYIYKVTATSALLQPETK